MPATTDAYKRTFPDAKAASSSADEPPYCVVCTKDGTEFNLEVTEYTTPLNREFMNYLSSSMHCEAGSLWDVEAGAVATTCRPGRRYLLQPPGEVPSSRASTPVVLPSKPLTSHIDMNHGSDVEHDLREQLTTKLKQLHQYQPKESLDAQKQKMIMDIQLLQQQAIQIQQYATATNLTEEQQTYYGALLRALQLKQRQLAEMELYSLQQQSTAAPAPRKPGAPTGQVPSTTSSASTTPEPILQNAMNGTVQHPFDNIAGISIRPMAMNGMAPSSARATSVSPAISSTPTPFMSHTVDSIPQSSSAATSRYRMQRSITPTSGRSTAFDGAPMKYNTQPHPLYGQPLPKSIEDLGLQQLSPSSAFPVVRAADSVRRPQSRSQTPTNSKPRPDWRFFASTKPVRDPPPTWHEVALPEIDATREGMPEILKLTNGMVGARETSLWAQGLRSSMQKRSSSRRRGSRASSRDVSLRSNSHIE